MKFTHIPITINQREVIRYLGFKKDKTESSEHVDELIGKLINKAKYILEPTGIIKTVSIDYKESSSWELHCDGGAYIIKGEKIFKHLENCELVTLMAVTVGPEIDRIIDDLFVAEQPTEALIYDAIGSDAAERVADYVNEYVINEAKRKGYTTRFRFSPGYGGWSVENQQALIDYVDADQVGIQVLKYSQLTPRKSVSAVIGWVPNQANANKLQDSFMAQSNYQQQLNIQNKNSSKCNRCDTNECQYRDA